MSQQPYQQPGQQQGQQPGQQSGYPQPGAAPQGYPQGYQQPGQQQGYGGYQQPQRSGAGAMNLNTAAGVAPILQILGFVVAGLGVLAAILAFTIDGISGSYKFQQFVYMLFLGLGLGGVLVGLAAILRSRPNS